MKKSTVIELTKASIVGMIPGVIEVIKFDPILKWETFYDGDWLWDSKDYLDTNGEVIEGHLVLEKQLICQEVDEGMYEVNKEIYILPNGDFEVFYATYKGEYEYIEIEGKEREKRILYEGTRVRSKESSLSQTEIQDILYTLLKQLKKNN